MNHVYLERHDDKDNLHRFYQMFVTPGLFDDWSLIKEWGRVGSPGTVKKEWFDTQEEAIAARNKLCAAKFKKGYKYIHEIAIPCRQQKLDTSSDNVSRDFPLEFDGGTPGSIFV